MKTLVLANQKGGVGKSAVATLLVHYFAQHGQRVLAIDLDHQGNFSKPLRMSERAAVAACTADVLMTGSVGSVPSKPFVLVPSDRALLGLERQPAMHTPFARAFRAFLATVDSQFDVCVIDTNPNPDDLHRWRETFAEKLRGMGIDAEATRQASRGNMRNYEPLWRVKAGQDGRLLTARGRFKGSPASVASRAEAVEAQGHIAKALAASADASDRGLAQAVAGFVRELPGARPPNREIGAGFVPEQGIPLGPDYQR